MRFEEMLVGKREALVQGLAKEVLAAYPEDAAVLFQRQKDPFANPVGHSAREGASEIVDALLAESEDPEAVRESLEGIVRIRAVQQFSPSTALSFVFSLKSVIRKALPEASRDPRHSEELAAVDARIDSLALAAFDVYAECREQVNQLRINEVKRQVEWVVEKMNERDPSAWAPPEWSAKDRGPEGGTE